MLKDIIENFQATRKVESGSLLEKLQQKALQLLKSIDFPTTEDEEWKYTNIKKLVNTNFFVKNSDASYANLSHFFPQTECYRLVYVNGIFREDLSSVLLDNNAVVHNLYEAYSSHQEIINQYLDSSTLHTETAFTAINAAWVKHGAFIYVRRGKALQKPVFLVHVQDTRSHSSLAQLRHLIIVEPGSQLCFVEQYYTLGQSESLMNLVCEAFISQSARMNHVLLQTEKSLSSFVNFTQVHQAQQSHYTNTTLTLGGQLVRNNLHVSLEGEHAEAFMYGLYMLKGNTHADNHTAVDHRVPNCHSNELYKGLLDERSTGVFNGKIFVRPNAQKTNAYQSNKNILLSQQASMNTKPQLEIWADDVKCSHGTTTGALEEEPLFYLQSRGICQEKARALLIYAFVAEILEKIQPLFARQAAEQMVKEWLGNQLEIA